jgi:hypothetical protein
MPGVEDTVALRTQADKPAEVSVSAHGETVFAVTVNANDARRFRARETFEITSNDSGAARLELNGQTMPPPGASGQPGSQTLAPENLSTRPGEAH